MGLTNQLIGIHTVVHIFKNLSSMLQLGSQKESKCPVVTLNQDAFQEHKFCFFCRIKSE